MFEAPPEKPSAFGFYWLILLGAVGGVAGIVGGVMLLGSERLQESETLMIGSFLIGAAVFVVMGRRLYIPQRTSPE
jgi:hypothetical protein